MGRKIIFKTDDETVNDYLACYDSINIDEIKILTSLFDKLENYELSSGRFLDEEEDYIRYGIKLNKKEKEYHAMKRIELSQEQFINMYDNDDKNVYFYRSVSTLIKVCPYISINDRIQLNNLFDNLSRLERGIDELVEANDALYLPICNNKVKFKR